LAPRSPDIIPCDVFLWGYAKERVNVPPLPADLDEITNRITAAVNSVTVDISDAFEADSTIALMLSVQQVEGT
jgi:hypothetical protein